MGKDRSPWELPEKHKKVTQLIKNMVGDGEVSQE